MKHIDAIIIGASASGLMCAIESAKRGRNVLVLDHANKAGKKILMSGGGRCNFTNYDVSAANYISHNPHFVKSALSRFTQWDFIDKVHRHHIAYHERDHGQLFCDDSAKDILNMLLDECKQHHVQIMLNTDISKVSRTENNSFSIESNQGNFDCASLVIASGGLSIPKMCASPFGYKVAEQFGIKVWPTFAGLVPFTLQPEDKEKYSTLSGIAIDCIAENERASFRENLLFTHRGLSGPAILQISSYWKAGEVVEIKLLPELNLFDELKNAKRTQSQKLLKTILSQFFPKSLSDVFTSSDLLESPIQQLSDERLKAVSAQYQHWQIKPNGTEGYRTAEVTLGGVDCDAVSSKTMESTQVPGLYFIGEVLDVTGWLGGYNFQWAWSSGWVAGQYA